MEFLLWFFGIWLGTVLIFRLFGRQILQFGLQKIMRRLQKEAQSQRQAYERHFEAGDMSEHVYAEEEYKVTARRAPRKSEVRAEEIAEDVEFEELP